MALASRLTLIREFLIHRNEDLDNLYFQRVLNVATSPDRDNLVNSRAKVELKGLVVIFWIQLKFEFHFWG